MFGCLAKTGQDWHLKIEPSKPYFTKSFLTKNIASSPDANICGQGLFKTSNVLMFFWGLILCLTCWNFSNIICSHIIFNWLIKNVFSINPNVVIFYFYFWKVITFMYTFLSPSFSNDKTKNLFTPWKLGSIKKSKYWFTPSVGTFVWYLFQLIVLLKPHLIVAIVLHYLVLIKLQQEHNVLYLLF